MTAVKEISLDAAAAAVLSELGGIFTIREEHKKVTEGFSWWSAMFCVAPTVLATLRRIAASYEAVAKQQIGVFRLNVTDSLANQSRTSDFILYHWISNCFIQICNSFY